jgi:TonB family protein
MPSGVTIPVSIQVWKGQSLLRTQTFEQDIIKIGKLTSSHLQLEDESVSRMHAVIEVSQGGEVKVLDLGSTRGTFLNGQRVSKATVLRSGDEVRVGDVRLIVSLGEAQSAADGDATMQVAAGDIPVPQAGPRPTTMGVAAVASPPPSPLGAIAPAPPPVAGIAASGPPAMPAPGNVPSPFGVRHAAPAAPVVMPMAPVAVPPQIAEQVEVRDGSYAVEVSAMFEDAVLEVRHFDDPQGGQISNTTKGVLGSAAAAMLAVFVLFLVTYVQVARYKHAREQWEKEGKPASEFRAPPREGPARDILGIGLMLYGIGAAVYGLYRLLGERGENQFTIGPDPSATFAVPGEQLPNPAFPLVRSTGTDYEINFTHLMTGDLRLGDKTMSLTDLVGSGQARPSAQVSGAYSMMVPQGGRFNLRFGDATFNVNSVPRPRRYPVPLAINWAQQSYTGAVFLGTALFLLLIFSVPPDPKSLSLDAFMNDQRLARFLVKPEEQKQEDMPDWLKKQQEENSGGKRAKEAEGKMGKKESKNQKGLFAIKGPEKNTDLKLAKELAKDAALKAGVLGIINAGQGSPFASIFSRDNSALGNQANDVLGGLVGTEVGDAYGGSAFGIVGTGTGGGGTGEGTIGLGNLGTIGRGSGTPGGGMYGARAGQLKSRKAGAPEVVPGTAEVRGSLDKELIRRIIRRHINEVKFCYEKELTRQPNLQGRVMVQFTIGATGQVISSVVQSSTMGNAVVEQCIAGAVRRWEFPKPQGGIVIVTYPFVLKASDG